MRVLRARRFVFAALASCRIQVANSTSTVWLADLRTICADPPAAKWMQSGVAGVAATCVFVLVKISVGRAKGNATIASAAAWPNRGAISPCRNIGRSHPIGPPIWLCAPERADARANNGTPASGPQAPAATNFSQSFECIIESHALCRFIESAAAAAAVCDSSP